MNVDAETHAMRFLSGLLGLGILVLLAMVALLIGMAGWLVILAIAAGAVMVYGLGVFVLALMDRLDR